jgi:hypothetical protein
MAVAPFTGKIIGKKRQRRAVRTTRQGRYQRYFAGWQMGTFSASDRLSQSQVQRSGKAP